MDLLKGGGGRKSPAVEERLDRVPLVVGTSRLLGLLSNEGFVPEGLDAALGDVWPVRDGDFKPAWDGDFRPIRDGDERPVRDGEVAQVGEMTPGGCWWAGKEC